VVAVFIGPWAAPTPCSLGRSLGRSQGRRAEVAGQSNIQGVGETMKSPITFRGKRRIVRGWKNLEVVVGVPARTIQRWEQEMVDPPPVKRDPGGRVWVDYAKLRAWMEKHGVAKDRGMAFHD